MFGRATITLGVGPHASFLYFLYGRLLDPYNLLNVVRGMAVEKNFWYFCDRKISVFQ